MNFKVTYSSLSWLLVHAQICHGRIGKVDSYLRRRLKGAQENSFVCITEEQCKEKFLSMSIGGTFLVGEYPTKGCFSKSDNVYFGTGSVVDEDLAKTDLPGIQVRIWCDHSETEEDTTSEHPTAQPSTRFNPTKQPKTQAFKPSVLSTPPIEVDDNDIGMDASFFNDMTPSPTFAQFPTHEQEINDSNLTGMQAVCTQDQCREKFLSLSSSGGRFIVGDFPTKGCFSKSINVYFGTGSATEEEMTEDTLPGVQTRIWCDRESKAPTMKPSLQTKTSDNPTIQAPTNNLTDEISTRTNTPTVQPHMLQTQKPITTISPTTSVSEPPSSEPTPILSTTRPTNQPTLNPVTSSLTNYPSQMQETTQPTTNPTSMMPSKEKHTARPTLSKPETVSLTSSHLDSQMPESHLPTSKPFSTPVPTTTSPSNGHSTTHSPRTKQPTMNPVTSYPSNTPTSSDLDSQMLGSHLPTNQPLSTPVPTTASPSNGHSSTPSHRTKQPTLNPVTSYPSNTPTSSPLDSQMLESNLPTNRPLSTPIPTTASASNGHSSTSSHRVEEPTLNPVTTNTSKQPSKNQFSTAIGQTVSMSPLTISLQTDPQIESIDVIELRFFILNHLLNELEDKFPYVDGSSSYVFVSAVLLGKLRYLQQEEADGDSSATVTKEFRIAVSGIFRFSGDSVPSVEVLDEVTRESFAGKSGDEFVRSLQNASDDGLQSTRSVSVIASNSDAESEVVELVKSPLKSTVEEDSDGRTSSWYLLSIVFSVGLVLVAMHIMKTHIIKSDDEELSEVNRSNEATEEKERNSGNSQFDVARDNMSTVTIVVEQVATGIMSSLTNDYDENCYSLDSIENKTAARDSDPTQCLSKSENSKISFKRTNVFCCIGDADDSKSSNQSCNGINEQTILDENLKAGVISNHVSDGTSQKLFKTFDATICCKCVIDDTSTPPVDSERSELTGNKDWNSKSDANGSHNVETFQAVDDAGGQSMSQSNRKVQGAEEVSTHVSNSSSHKFQIFDSTICCNGGIVDDSSTPPSHSERSEITGNGDWNCKTNANECHNIETSAVDDASDQSMHHSLQNDGSASSCVGSGSGVDSTTVSRAEMSEFNIGVQLFDA